MRRTITALAALFLLGNIARADGPAFLIEDISPDSSHTARPFIPFGEKVLFSTTSLANGFEPWVSNGFPEGTTMLIAATTGNTHGGMVQTAVFDGSAYFTASRTPSSAEVCSLYVTDGTTAGTTHLPLPNEVTLALGPTVLAQNGNVLIVGAERTTASGAGSGTNARMFFYDTDSASFEQVATFGTDGPSAIRVLSNRLFFVISKLSTDEIWRMELDGTGETRLAILSAGSNISRVIGSKLVFYARTDDDFFGLNRLYSFDSVAGTIAQISTIFPDTSALAQGCEFKGKVYFSASINGTNLELWSTNGASGGTALVKEIMLGSPPSTPQSFCALEDFFIFTATTGAGGREIYKSDGTASGTQLFIELAPGAASASPANLTQIDGNRFVFSATTAANGTELWMSDGTPGGTRMLQDINPGPTSSSPEGFTRSGNRMYFTAIDAVAGKEPFQLYVGTAGVGNVAAWSALE